MIIQYLTVFFQNKIWLRRQMNRNKAGITACQEVVLLLACFLCICIELLSCDRATKWVIMEIRMMIFVKLSRPRHKDFLINLNCMLWFTISPKGTHECTKQLLWLLCQARQPHNFCFVGLAKIFRACSAPRHQFQRCSPGSKSGITCSTELINYGQVGFHCLGGGMIFLFFIVFITFQQCPHTDMTPVSSQPEVHDFYWKTVLITQHWCDVIRACRNVPKSPNEIVNSYKKVMQLISQKWFIQEQKYP